jgi:drug/metabolite transporter (DMT)-like permease
VTPPGSRLWWLAIAGVCLSYAIQSGQMAVTRHGILAGLTPYDLTALRLFIAGTLLLPLVVHAGLRDLGGLGWRRGTILALFAGPAYFLAINVGLAFAPAGHASLFNPATITISSFILAWWLTGERPTGAKLLGMVLILLGLSLVTGQALLGDGGGSAWIGDLLFVFSGIMWSFYIVLTRRWNVVPFMGPAIVSLMSFVLLPLYFAVAGPRLFEASTDEFILQAVYGGVVNGVVAMCVFVFAVRTIGASLAALFAAMVPILGTLFAIPLLGEHPTALQIAGMILASVGMVVAVIRSAR